MIKCDNLRVSANPDSDAFNYELVEAFRSENTTQNVRKKNAHDVTFIGKQFNCYEIMKFKC